MDYRHGRTPVAVGVVAVLLGASGCTIDDDRPDLVQLGYETAGSSGFSVLVPACDFYGEPTRLTLLTEAGEEVAAFDIADGQAGTLVRVDVSTPVADVSDQAIYAVVTDDGGIEGWFGAIVLPVQDDEGTLVVVDDGQALTVSSVDGADFAQRACDGEFSP